MDTNGLSLPVGGYEESRKVYDDQRQQECIEFMAQVSHARRRHSSIEANFLFCNFYFLSILHILFLLTTWVQCKPLRYIDTIDIIYYLLVFRLTQFIPHNQFINMHAFFLFFSFNSLLYIDYIDPYSNFFNLINWLSPLFSR